MVFSSSYYGGGTARLIVWVYLCYVSLIKARLQIWLCHTHYLAETTTPQQWKVLPGYNPWQAPAVADGAPAGYHCWLPFLCQAQGCGTPMPVGAGWAPASLDTIILHQHSSHNLKRAFQLAY